MSRRIVLVYQNGIANVFEVHCFNMAAYGREARRLLQADFRTCESFARGMGEAGCLVATAGCAELGDITHSRWTTDLNSLPFCDKLYPVWVGVVPACQDHYLEA